MKALGLAPDLDIIEKIVLDVEKDENKEILELLKPALNEASDKPEEALDYIAKYVNLASGQKDVKQEREKK